MILLTSSHQLNAGTETHGGDGIVCFRHNYTPNMQWNKSDLLGPVLLKDFWEYSQLSKLKISYIYKNFNDANKITLMVIDRIQRYHQKLALALHSLFENKINYFKFVNSSQLVPVDDSYSIIKPDPSENCHEFQLAVFKKGPMPDQFYSIINHKLFQNMTPIHQAGLYLHEMLFLVFQKMFHVLPEKNSLSYLVRYFNYIMFSEFDHKPFSSFQYLNAMVKSGLAYYLSKPYPGSNHRYFDLKYQGLNAFLLFPKHIKPNEFTELQQVSLRFRLAGKVTFPNEIMEPGKWRPIPVKHKDDLCVSLKYQELKHRGLCQ